MCDTIFFFFKETDTVSFQGDIGSYVFWASCWKVMPFTLSALIMQSYSQKLFLALHSDLQLFIGSNTAASEFVL